MLYYFESEPLIFKYFAALKAKFIFRGDKCFISLFCSFFDFDVLEDGYKKYIEQSQADKRS